MSIFIPRLNYIGTDTLDYYTTANPYYTMVEWGLNPATGQYEWLSDWMPNCTAYAYGRFNELAGEHNINNLWPTGDGVDWWWDAPNKGLSTGSTPHVGAAMVWGYYDEDPNYGHPGHVAIVEQLIYDSLGNLIAIRTSNSAWNSYNPPRTPQNSFPWFYLADVNPNNMDRMTDNTLIGTFKGFVYHPDYPVNVPPMTTNKLAALIGGQNKDVSITILKRRRM